MGCNARDIKGLHPILGGSMTIMHGAAYNQRQISGEGDVAGWWQCIHMVVACCEYSTGMLCHGKCQENKGYDIVHMSNVVSLLWRNGSASDF